MSFKKNVVERLFVVRIKVNETTYQLRVKAESEETAKEKAKRDVMARFNSIGSIDIVSVDRIDPDDYI